MIRFCIIIGAAKAGTTSLFNHLMQHPQIAPCRDKEPNFFSKHYNKGYEWYLSQWEGADIQNQILLEATINYTHSDFPIQVSRNILDFSKKHPISIKFIYIMRDPIKRLESHHTYSYTHQVKWSLKTALDKGYIIQTSRYAQQLDPFFEKFNPENFSLLYFSDLKKKPQQLLKKICEFLEIDENYEFSGLKKIHNKSEGKIVTRPIENLYRKHPYMETIAKIFPKKLKLFVQKMLLREKITEKFELNPQQRKRVYDALKDDMTRLHDEYGVDVAKWGF